MLSRSAFLTFLAGCLLALAARGVLGRLGRLLGGIRVGLGLGLGGRLISGRLGGLAGGVLTGDVLGGLLGAARQDTKDGRKYMTAEVRTSSRVAWLGFPGRDTTIFCPPWREI